MGNGLVRSIVYLLWNLLFNQPSNLLGVCTDLGPPLVSASEGEGPYDVWNPSYELTQCVDTPSSFLPLLWQRLVSFWSFAYCNCKVVIRC